MPFKILKSIWHSKFSFLINIEKLKLENTTISIVSTLDDSVCVETEDGQKIFELIKVALSERRTVKLSFLNVEMLSSAFLNSAIGQLYRDFPERLIKENLIIENLSLSGGVSLKRVVSTAKLYYKDPEAMQKIIDDILDE